ncbi:hypothetical protein [Rhodococcus wratislaviensis]|uniref:Cupin 2 conserved barrel domain-containing protein n=1 Tax=Rhodococcus wratislaviensis NBRC 100605 TaxID=1219028 RepID=X0Q9N4_RHOWR|nr:hypothetical protein [Rhodococcus wratislaviensis]GAF47626.1 hypothetical protein RW1_043_00610 [Rhodococcus wratislaviensis NBRC 100605]
MHVVETDKIPYELVTKRNRAGRVHRKFVREGEVSPGVGFTADLVFYEGGHGTFNAPRHRHNFDQIRFIVSGQPDFGDGIVADDGQAAFFPAGAHYGPEVIEQAEVMLIQWSSSWVTREQHDATYAEMQKVGEFKDGYYVTVDADGNEHRADGRNSVWETFTGRQLTYPTARYPQTILMNPEGFEWRPVSAGLQVKSLGRFTEDEVYVSAYRWTDGQGALDLSPERMQFIWVSEGEVSVGTQTYGPRTVIFSDLGESVVVNGKNGASAVVFGMPVPASGSSDR